MTAAVRVETHGALDLSVCCSLQPSLSHDHSIMEVGFPPLVVNLLRQAMNASEVRSETNSKCTALTDITATVTLDNYRFPNRATLEVERSSIV